MSVYIYTIMALKFRILDFPNRNDHLSKAQFGFPKGHDNSYYCCYDITLNYYLFTCKLRTGYNLPSMKRLGHAPPPRAPVVIIPLLFTVGHSVECGITLVTITIPICMLGGLEESDLQLNDPGCSITAKSERVDGDIVITISYDECSWQQTVSFQWLFIPPAYFCEGDVKKNNLF